MEPCGRSAVWLDIMQTLCQNDVLRLGILAMPATGAGESICRARAMLAVFLRRPCDACREQSSRFLLRMSFVSGAVFHRFGF